MNFSKQQIFYGAGFLLAGLLLGWILFSGSGESHNGFENLSEAELEQHIEDSHTDEEGNVIYTCSMHPSVRQNEPGNCPICGMELIPVDVLGEAEEDEYSMIMTPASARLANIQTARVERRIPEKELHLPGRIQVDERRITKITAHFPARIIDAKVDFTGVPIRKGEVMATVYSSELISAQRELLEAARQKDRNPRLYEASRQKFKNWEFTEKQIDEIENRGEVQRELEISSPVDGYVLTRKITDEQHVQEGTVLYEVADLSRVWVMLEAYEEDLGWIDTGHSLTFHTRSNPGQTFEGVVSYIDPVVDSNSRTVGVRVDVKNTGLRLKPDMLVWGVLNAEADSKSLIIPATSVLWTGPRSLVYIQDISVDVPRFEVRQVELGPRTGDYYIVESGLEEGEKVVFHGNFRIDSEFQLADKFSMMNREPGSGARAGHNHGSEEVENQEMEQNADDHSGHGSHSEVLMEEDIETLIPEYLKIRKALTNDDFEAAQAYMEVFTDEDFSDIEELRAEFKVISETLIDRIESEGYEGELFKLYCPMYDGGSTWISDRKEIENPFYGDEMHNCGETVEGLNAE